MAQATLPATNRGVRVFPKSKHVRVNDDDGVRATLFREAYGLRTKVRSTTYNDEDWNWDMVVVNFRDTLGKNYGLVEYFKAGKDNSTDHVDLEYEDKDGTWKNIRFDDTNSKPGEIYYTAELALVDLMQRRLRGDE